MRQSYHLEEIRQRLWRFFRREGRLPSYQEMCFLFGYASKNAAFKLTKKLIEKAFLKKGVRDTWFLKDFQFP